MRTALLVTTIVLTSVVSHAQDFLPPVFLSPRFVASVNAPSSIVIAPNEEPGERLIVTGRVTAGGKPLAGVSIYAFHADAEGRYTKDGSNSDENARLHGALRTDAVRRHRAVRSRRRAPAASGAACSRRR